MLRLVLPTLLVATVMGCNCSGQTKPDPGSDDGTTYTYDLVEATGEWNVTGSNQSGGCTYTTTSSRQTVSLAAPMEDAATFVPDFGSFVAFGQVDLTIGQREGSATCSSGTTTCPSSPTSSIEIPSLISVQPDQPLPQNAADGMAFVPVVSGVGLPNLCNDHSFDVSPAHLRGKPITVAQLKSGRFVVEAQGSLPLLPTDVAPGDEDPSALSGTLNYTYRLVFQSKSYDPAKAVQSTAFDSYDECLVDPVVTDTDLEAAGDAFAAGGTDIPLSSNGCRRLKVIRHGDDLTLSHELTRGTKLVYDAATGKSHAERDAVTTYVREKDAAGVRERYDSDHDGFFEAETETTFAGDVWQSTVTREYAPGSTVVVRQSSRTRVDDTTMSVRVEVSGAVVDEYDSAIQQTSCFTPSSTTAPDCAPSAGTPPVCGGGTSPCSRAQRKSIFGKLTRALRKGTKCLQDVGFDGFQPDDKGLTLIPTDQIHLQCSTNPCDPYGSFNTEPNKDGTHNLTVNVVTNNDVELAKTLFHELLHSDARFTHDDNLVSASIRACKLQLTDRTYACETMCFNPAAGGACACERCLNPDKGQPSQKVCDKCNSKYGICPGRHETNGTSSQNISQAVGAWCPRLKTFCDTKAECDTECSALGTACSPVKTTCDKNCN